MRRASFFYSGRAAIESSGQTVSFIVYTIPAWKSRKFLARPELRLVNPQVFPRRKIQHTDESCLCHFAQRANGGDTALQAIFNSPAGERPVNHHCGVAVSTSFPQCIPCGHAPVRRERVRGLNPQVSRRTGGEDIATTENPERIAAANRVQMTADCYDSNCPRSEKI
jgi:hypothetical protein